MDVEHKKVNLQAKPFFMSEKANNPGKPAPDRINSVNQNEVSYWTKKFKVSSITLVNAVTEAGPMVKDVRKWLKNNRFKFDLADINLITGVVNTQFFFPVQIPIPPES